MFKIPTNPPNPAKLASLVPKDNICIVDKDDNVVWMTLVEKVPPYWRGIVYFSKVIPAETRLEFEPKYIHAYVTHREALLSWYISLFENQPEHPLHPSKTTSYSLEDEEVFTLLEWYKLNGNDPSIDKSKRQGVSAMIAMMLTSAGTKQ